MTARDLDPLRSRLASLGRPHTPTDQAWIESLNGHIKAEYPHLLAIRDAIAATLGTEPSR